jgi:hypothetical protein
MSIVVSLELDSASLIASEHGTVWHGIGAWYWPFRPPSQCLLGWLNIDDSLIE